MRVLYAKNGGALAVEAEKEASFDFLFQHIEIKDTLDGCLRNSR